MKYELYVGLSDKDNNPIEETRAINFLLDQAVLMQLNISILKTDGIYNSNKEKGLQIIHIEDEKSIKGCRLPPALNEHHKLKILGDMYKTRFNQECYILNGVINVSNVY